ncbi:MAG: tetratricopeptide repeat protein, partial [Bacteroidales bacterium]|nr:tetratricopeptide repeat protein [Bacteroidales bacterium]
MESITNKIITFSILSIWAILICMGIFTLISPAWLEKISDPGKNVEATMLKDLGDGFLKNHQYQQAITQYTFVLKIIPDMKSAIANLAVAYQKTGKYKNAIISLNYLLKKDPEYPNIIYYNLAEIYEKLEQPKKAIHNYLLASETAPFPAISYQKAGKLLMDQKKYNKAIEYFNDAINSSLTIENAYKGMLIRDKESYNDDPEIYNNFLKLIETESYTKNLKVYDESIFDEMLKHNVSFSKTYNNIGFCLAMKKEYKAAISNFNQALEIYPGLIDAQNNIKAVEKLM